MCSSDLFQTAIADSVDFQFVLQHVKPLGSCDLDLQLLDPILFEFQYFSAFGADHMIMVLTQMPVFVKNHATVKTALMGKSKTAHQLKGFVDEIPFQFPTVAFQQPYDILDGHVLFGLQESLQDFEPILEIVDVFLFEQLLELPLFLKVNLFHFSIKIRCPNRTGTKRNKLPQRHQNTKEIFGYLFIFVFWCLRGVNDLTQNNK